MTEVATEAPAGPPISYDGLQVVWVPVDAIDANPWNPNKQSELVARATRQSLERFGFVEPVALWYPPDFDEGRYQIVNGEHRWTEARALGYEKIPAVILSITEAEAKKLTVVLNETTGDADVVLLGQLLSELQDLPDFRVALPYTETELEHLLTLGQEDWDQFRHDDPDPQPPSNDPAVKEVVLSFTQEQEDVFRGWVTILEKESGLSGVSAVVFETVRSAALAANQG